MLAGFFGGFQAPPQSVVDLLLAHRNARLAEQFPQSLLEVKGTAASVLPGPRSHAQAHSALELWEPLSMIWKALGGSGTDVLIDAGRLGMESYAEVLLRHSDLVLLVTKADLPCLAAAKQWAEGALETHRLHPETPAWAVVLVGSGHPYSSKEVSSVLDLPVLAQLPFDPKGASAYSHGSRRKRKTRLSRGLLACGDRVRDQLAAADRLLAPGGGS